MSIPTRWRTAIEDQLTDAAQRVRQAEEQLAADQDGARALQAAYQAVVAAASVRVWAADAPWNHPLAADEMQRRIQGEFPNHFSALAALDVGQALTSGWSTEAATPYVAEASAFVRDTAQQIAEWLGTS